MGRNMGRSPIGIPPKASSREAHGMPGYHKLSATRIGRLSKPGRYGDGLGLWLQVWIVSAARMKAGREHRVPLSDQVSGLLQRLPREDGNEYVFIGGKKGAPLSNMAMLETLRELRPGLTVHGFRSTFRDWAAETTSYPNHVVEMALAHAVGDKVEAAYRRGDLFDKRRRLMNEWGRYCDQKRATKLENVTLLLRPKQKVS